MPRLDLPDGTTHHISDMVANDMVIHDYIRSRYPTIADNINWANEAPRAECEAFLADGTVQHMMMEARGFFEVYGVQ